MPQPAAEIVEIIPDVALIGLPPDHARAAELAGAVRNMRVRHFDDAASALAWLRPSA